MDSKDKLLTVRVTEQQLDYWKRKANKEGSTISNKVRMMLVREYGLPDQPKGVKFPVRMQDIANI